MRSRRRLLAVAGALAALVVCAWFALSLRQADAVDRATTIVESASPLTRQDAQRARHQLHVAGQLNPDRTVTVLQAQLAARLGNRRQAERLLDQVVTAEPNNAVAWYDLATVAPDARTAARSLHEVNQLDPNKF